MKLTLMVGPPGSGKSTLAHNLINNNGPEGRKTAYINQDTQGKQHMIMFLDAVYLGMDIIVDRMGFNKEQRSRYIGPAKEKGYEVEVIILCESQETCFKRVMERQNHPTIKDETSARAALKTFFTRYEPPTDDEGIDVIRRVYPEGKKPTAIYSDLDGTLCDVEHRRHFVRAPVGYGILGRLDIVTEENPFKAFKKDWKSFFAGIKDDTVNYPVMHLLMTYAKTHPIVYCTGRDDNYRKVTQEWLDKWHAPKGELFMRHRNDSRADYLVKEVLLDFEVLTRYDILFCLDDRDQVVDMLRRRGLTVFQVAKGDF